MAYRINLARFVVLVGIVAVSLAAGAGVIFDSLVAAVFALVGTLIASQFIYLAVLLAIAAHHAVKQSRGFSETADVSGRTRLKKPQLLEP